METLWYKSFWHIQFLEVVIMIAVVTLSLVPYQSAVHLLAIIILYHSLYLLANVGFGNTKTVIFKQCCNKSYSKLHLSVKDMLMHSSHFWGNKNWTQDITQKLTSTIWQKQVSDRGYDMRAASGNCWLPVNVQAFMFVCVKECVCTSSET